jgi:[histone H3]-trimethyl-L-lysine4 demethylase
LLYFRIRPEASKYGICKIVPPKEWQPTCHIDINSSKVFSTRRQTIHTLQQGKGFPDGRSYTLPQYAQMANAARKAWIDQYHGGQEVSNEQLERDYWDLVETNTRQAVVDYGNDLDTTAFFSGFSPAVDQSQVEPFDVTNPPVAEGKFLDSFYEKSGWNLNNLPSVKGSVLRFLKTPINGINVPWLYLGSLFASFCWHNEDNYFSSVNYSHFGATKQWYGVPGEHAETFEKVSE